MATFPNGTGPALQSKSTSYDATTNTTQHMNGADWNDARTLIHAMRDALAGSYRGFVERRSGGTLTAVRVHTCQALVDGRRKTVASGRLLIPGVTGTVWVYVRGNTGATVMAVRTAAAEPAPYATATRDFPLAKVVISGGAMTITATRPDWVMQHRV